MRRRRITISLALNFDRALARTLALALVFAFALALSLFSPQCRRTCARTYATRQVTEAGLRPEVPRNNSTVVLGPRRSLTQSRLAARFANNTYEKTYAT